VVTFGGGQWCGGEEVAGKTEGAEDLASDVFSFCKGGFVFNDEAKGIAGSGVFSDDGPRFSHGEAAVRARFPKG
jgi:hypothetical protein